jgi:hypothetical protein
MIHFLKAIAPQTTSTTPKGHAPLVNPYALASKQPQAKPNVKVRCRDSSAYIATMKVKATTPKTVTTL